MSLGQEFGPKMTAFLAAISVMPSVSRAAKAAGIDRSSHYEALRKSAAYAKAFAAAVQQGFDAVSDEAILRAKEGWDEPIVYQGNFVYPLIQKGKKWVEDKSKGPLTVRKIDNKLLQFVLESRHPDYKPTVNVKGELDIRVTMERLAAGRKRVAELKAAREQQ